MHVVIWLKFSDVTTNNSWKHNNNCNKSLIRSKSESNPSEISEGLSFFTSMALNKYLLPSSIDGTCNLNTMIEHITFSSDSHISCDFSFFLLKKGNRALTRISSDVKHASIFFVEIDFYFMRTEIKNSVKRSLVKHPWFSAHIVTKL